MLLRSLVFLALVLAPTQLWAQPPNEDKPKPGNDEGSALATAAAVFPGLVLHGSGHFVKGDRKTAYKLLRWQAVGLGMGIASGLFLRYSGGSRYANEVTIPLLVSGSGLIINTFVADLYGSASGGNGYRFERKAKQSASLSYAYIADPQFQYSHFALASARVDFGDMSVSPRLWTALNDDNQRARLPLRYRLANEEGEYVEAVGATTYHRYGTEKFSTYLGELSLGVRLEMRRLGETLKGSFATISVGGGLQRTRYNVGSIPSDTIGLLLGHFGYGFYLPKAGELELYYEHRRDDFTAGLSPSSRNGSGFLGHFGVKLHQPVSKRFSLVAHSELGSAWLIAAGLETQWGTR